MSFNKKMNKQFAKLIGKMNTIPYNGTPFNNKENELLTYVPT